MYENFLFRKSWWSILKTLPSDQRSEVIDCISQYMFDGTEPVFESPSAVSMAFQFIMQDIMQDKERYDTTSEKRREAGRKGGLRRANTDGGSVSESAESAESCDGDIAEQAAEANGSKRKQTEANGSKSKQEEANGSKSKQTEANQALDKEKEKEKENNTLSLSPSAALSGDIESGREREEAKEEVIFCYAMDLLSEGRPNAYSEAEQAYNYNDGFGWTKETTKPNGDVVKQQIRDKLSWLRSRKAKNEQMFAPADGMLLAEILRQTGCLPGNRSIIDGFRGFRQNPDDTLSLLYTPLGASKKLKAAIEHNDRINVIVFSALQRVYPGTKGVDFRRG